MKVYILDDYTNSIHTLPCFDILKSHDVTVLHDHYTSVESLVKKIKDAEILILNRTCTPIGEPILKAVPTIKLISQTGKNAGHIDVEACTRHNVAIAEGKGDPIAPAELTWSLIMNGLRKVCTNIQSTKRGEWQSEIGDVVYGKQIGIWGYGRIGKRIARYASAFEAEVMVWGSEHSRKQAEEDGHRAAETKREFFETCDVVSLHLRLNESTRGIVAKDDLLRMKPNALFVNTSRSALVEEGALLYAIQQEPPLHAALDVYDTEPLDASHPYLEMEHVLCTPHIGYVERRSFEMYYKVAFENVVAYSEGSPMNILNPRVLS